MTKENQLDFGGRVAVVTGAGSGMGREYAEMLGSRGARVVVNDLAADKAEQTVQAITEAGGTAIADGSDIVSNAAELVQTAIDNFGRLDIVINNAGITGFGRFWETDPDAWWRVFNVSFRGTVEVTRNAMPHLIESGSGRIINTASNGMIGGPNASAYSAAKAAIWGLDNALAVEAHEVGVQVSTILPAAWTPMTEGAFDHPAVQKVLREQFPPTAVAAFVTWLAHQDTTVYGESFEIGGAAAARTVFTAMPRVRIDHATPEEWAANAAVLMQKDGELTQLRSASESLRSQIVFLAPELETEIPENPSDVSGS